MVQLTRVLIHTPAIVSYRTLYRYSAHEIKSLLWHSPQHQWASVTQERFYISIRRRRRRRKEEGSPFIQPSAISYSCSLPLTLSHRSTRGKLTLKILGKKLPCLGYRFHRWCPTPSRPISWPMLSTLLPYSLLTTVLCSLTPFCALRGKKEEKEKKNFLGCFCVFSC